jgi:Uma2 family endonuclease
MSVITMPHLEGPIRISFDPAEALDDDAYFAFCAENENLRIERSPQGEIIIVPPCGMESSFRNGEVFAQLRTWAMRTLTGKAFDSDCEFLLPSGAGYAPDASWVSNAKLATIPKSHRRKFPRVVPEFVVEVMSPSDRLPRARKKLQEWIEAGVELAWLIDGDAQTVWIYRPHREPETHTGITELAGEGPVEGFVLDLRDIWAGL